MGPPVLDTHTHTHTQFCVTVETNNISKWVIQVPIITFNKKSATICQSLSRTSLSNVILIFFSLILNTSEINKYMMHWRHDVNTDKKFGSSPAF